MSEGLIYDETNVKMKSQNIFSFIIGCLILARIKNDIQFLEENLSIGVFDLIGIDLPKKQHLKLTK